jgi:hypothetical protein
MNVQFLKAGRDSYDFPGMEKKHQDMLDGRPTVDFDFALP